MSVCLSVYFLGYYLLKRMIDDSISILYFVQEPAPIGYFFEPCEILFGIRRKFIFSHNH